jgi:ActR/RegA family two-component response regulator
MDALPERPRVLIVDDQKNWQEALHDMLESMYDVEIVASYDAARNHLRQRTFHVVVSDQRLVDTDATNIQGIRLLDDVHALEDGTQAIIVTGYPTIAAAKEALRGREAYDYMLKYPEEGGPFDIREYRQQVKEAANKAAQLRQKAITLGFSISALVADLTYDQIAATLFPRDTITHDVQENVMKAVNRLLYPFQPLAPRMGRAWTSETNQTCEILCWSREYGKAALARIGKEQHSLDASQVQWLKENWHLVKNDELVDVRLAGISYTIDGMAFDDFVSQAKGK